MALRVLTLTCEGIAMNAESSKPETILVVEDEAFVREVTCEILRSAGYPVLSATNATEAENVFLLCGAEIALLLTDIVLPGDNGRVLAGRLKHLCPSLKVLFATGYPEQMTGRWGVNGLAKPFSAATLLDRVANVLGHASAEFSKGFSSRRACGSAQPAECAQEFLAVELFG